MHCAASSHLMQLWFEQLTHGQKPVSHLISDCMKSQFRLAAAMKNTKQYIHIKKESNRPKFS